MVAKNDVTGDSIRSKAPSEAYRNNYDLIFGKKEKDWKEWYVNEGYTVDGEVSKEVCEAIKKHMPLCLDKFGTEITSKTCNRIVDGYEVRGEISEGTFFLQMYRDHK